MKCGLWLWQVEERGSEAATRSVDEDEDKGEMAPQRDGMQRSGYD